MVQLKSKVFLVMPRTCSILRINLLIAFNRYILYKTSYIISLDERLLLGVCRCISYVH